MSKIRDIRDILIREKKERERYTDKELAEMFNISRERIRQIVKEK